MSAGQMGGAGLGLGIVGTLTSAGAQIQQGQAVATAARAQGQIAATMDNYRASMSDYNATLDEQQAERAIAEANVNASIIERSTSRALGRASAAYGAAGVDMTGSAITVMHDLATEGTLQKNLALYAGSVAANDLRNRASLDKAQANLYRSMAGYDIWSGNYQASAAIQGAQMGATSTLLTGAGRAASAAYSMWGGGGGGRIGGGGTAP